MFAPKLDKSCMASHDFWLQPQPKLLHVPCDSMTTPRLLAPSCQTTWPFLGSALLQVRIHELKNQV